MIQITLSPEAREKLVETFKTTRDRRLRDRCQALLMKADKRSQTAIAKDLHVERRTVYNWLTTYLTGGLEALKITWGPGKQAFIPASLGATIQEWVKAGPAGCGLNRANWTYEELADYVYKQKGLWVSTSTMRNFCRRHHIRPYRPTYRFLRADPDKKQAAKAEIADVKKKAAVGELVLLSQDEARFPLVPTLRTTLGVKGSRPLVGTWDCKDLVYVVASVNVVQGNLTTRIVECAARIRAKTGKSKSRVLQEAFVRHLRDVARAYPAARYPRVVIMLDNAPWHRGSLVTRVLQAFPHLEFYRLPSYCPDLNPIERFWKILRRRASHHRLFETMMALRIALRGSICYFQTCRARILSLMGQCKRQRRKSEKKLSAP